MADKIVRIGGATAFFSDSAMGTAQFLAMETPPRYIVFDMLAETMMGVLAREAAAKPEAGFAPQFIDRHVVPHLPQLMTRGIRLIANAGGVNAAGCAQEIRRRAAELGLRPKVAVVEGDDLRHRLEEFSRAGFKEMFSGRPLAEIVEAADKVVSLSAYVGAFPIAQALAAGADIVVTGRAVDSAPALGALIHEFGWGPDDFDRLASGALVGHMLECSTQTTGGTFTDWEEVPNWANIGYPIAECRADGGFVITKPEGTGGLVSVGTCAEQLLYEVSDPQAYIVPDVVCDFTQVRFAQAGPNRVKVGGARGRGRTSTYKMSMTYDQGWRASTAFPVIGRDAVRKAERTGAEFIERTRRMLRDANLAEWRASRVEALGGEASFGAHASAGARATREVVCRITVDHAEMQGAMVLMREQPGITTGMSVGTSLVINMQLRPVTGIAAFLLPKREVELSLTLEGQQVPAPVPTDGEMTPGAIHPAPPPPEDLDGGVVPLIALAWARSGDKGDLFNVGVIARRPEYLPYIHAALTDALLADTYSHLLPAAPRIDRFFVPGFDAINYVLHESMGGGMMATLAVDAGAKGMAQLLIEAPVRISREMARDPALKAMLEAS